MENEHGKKAEEKIKLWLDRPDEGYCFDRIPDQMTGMFGSSNICDFDLYKYPNMYYLESKATYGDRLDFSMLTNKQRDGLLLKSQIPGVYGLVVVLFVSYKRAFIINIKDIAEFINPELSLAEQGKLLRKSDIISQLRVKSINIKKIDKWAIPYKEIRTIPSRKEFLDYEGEIEEYIPE